MSIYLDCAYLPGRGGNSGLLSWEFVREVVKKLGWGGVQANLLSLTVLPDQLRSEFLEERSKMNEKRPIRGGQLPPALERVLR